MQTSKSLAAQELIFTRERTVSKMDRIVVQNSPGLKFGKTNRVSPCRYHPLTLALTLTLTLTPSLTMGVFIFRCGPLSSRSSHAHCTNARDGGVFVHVPPGLGALCCSR